MEFFSGLGVGMDETAICVVDDKDEVALQVTVLTDPDAIKAALKPYLGRLRRVARAVAAIFAWEPWRDCGKARKSTERPKCARRHATLLRLRASSADWAQPRTASLDRLVAKRRQAVKAASRGSRSRKARACVSDMSDSLGVKVPCVT